MKRPSHPFLLSVFFILLTLNSCKKSADKEINPEYSKYVAAFTSGQVSSASPIQIELTQDMPSVELDKEIEEDLFEFSPSIKGKAYWTSTRNIKFVPEEGQLKAGQKYDAWFKLNKVMQVDKGFDDFYFYFKVPDQGFNLELLPYSPMKDNDLQWNSVQGSLMLADKANMDNIAKMFSLSGGNSKKAKIKITPAEESGKYNVNIDSLFRDNSDQEITLTLDGSQIGAKREKATYSINIPSLDASFQVIDVRTTYEPKECIRVTFSDPLSLSQNIQGLISLNGIQNYSYDIQGNVLKIYLDTYTQSGNIDLSVYKEVKNQKGKSLAQNYSYSLNFERNEPNIKILNTGNILPNADSLIIPIQAVNLWAVDVRVIKIYGNNILGYLQANDFGDMNELKRFGRLILKKRVRLDVDPTLRLNEWNNFALDLSSMIKKDPGAVYRIEFKYKQEYSLYPCNGVIPQRPTDASLERFEELDDNDMAKWDNPGYYYYDDDDWSGYYWEDREDPCKPTYYMGKSKSCVVLASNIGITAKLGSDKKLMVALTDILTTKPISGATVDVYNFQMQRIGSAKSDGDGFADIEYKGGVPFVVIASNGTEKGYLKVTSNLALSLSNFDVSGKEVQKGLKGFIYGERGVWRPGDSIYVTFVLEDKNNTLPKNHPVSLDLYTPRGQLYQRYMSTNGIDGFYAFRMATDPDAITGAWRAEVSVGGATFSKALNIETVKPNRLKIRFDAGKRIDASQGSITGSLSSQWLHGAPASGLAASVEAKLTMVQVPFKEYAKYSFNNPATNFYSETYNLFDGRLDASGNATVRANLPQAAGSPGMLQANIISRVFETGGDASIYSQTIPYSPFPAYIGVKSPAENDYEFLETDKDNVLDIVSVDPDGKLIDRNNLEVKIYKIRWSWWWSSEYENLSSYVNNTSTEVVLNETISTHGGKGKVKFRIDYPQWGRYLVMVKDPVGGHTTGKLLYIDWPSYRGRSNKQDASGATMLSFTTDKHTYKVGEKATVILPQSTNGRALITIEDGARIISRNWITTSETEDTKYTFTVTEEMAPNFYVGATLLQPHSQRVNDLPIRMYGVLNVSVENENTKLEPVINMPDELRPEKEFTVSISEKNKRDMTYTLAIVDDGLLDLTSFKTPNAWTDFYARQALGIRTWDLFDMVVGAQAGKFGALLSIGGDAENLVMGVNAGQKNKTVNRFKPVVKYLGPFTLKAGKTDTHKITLPPYFGSVRVMVVAGSSKGAYGSIEKTVQVKNPLMVLSTLPRVAGPNEEILLPVNVFAMDDKVKNVNVSVKSNGLFQFTDGTTKSLSFAKQGDKMLYFKVKVGKKTGAEKIVINATGGGETATETIEIEIRNPNPHVVMTSDAYVPKGDTVSLNLKLEDIQASDWIKMEVSRMPAVDLNKNLNYLLEYPHGCSEQVTSGTFPLLYMGNFVTMSQSQKERADKKIKEAIKILSSRQLSDGGIAYWPGDRYPTEWVTTYAGHFLVEAQRAGYNVPNSVISKWKSFQKYSAQRWSDHNLYSSYYSYSMSDLQQAYRLYTLALAGEAELGTMNRIKEMKDISVQARWRLAAAYVLAGRKDAANQLTKGVSDKIDKYSFNNDTYGSSTRDMAMIMETYLLLGKTDKALSIGREVASKLSNSYYISTQEAAFGLISMSKLAEKMGKGTISYDWVLNGTPQKGGSSSNVFQEVSINPTEQVKIDFKNKGQGDLFVRLIGRTQPIEDKHPAVSDGLNLYIRYVDDNGHSVDISSLKQGTEFYADVIVQNISGQYLTDLALTHIFASGWEIFNNRLFDQASNNNQLYSYRDIRDDRVLTYFNLSAGYSVSFRVKLQAAYCGRFYLPAVACEAMYSPDIRSRTTGQWVEVKQ